MLTPSCAACTDSMMLAMVPSPIAHWTVSRVIATPPGRLSRSPSNIACMIEGTPANT